MPDVLVVEKTTLFAEHATFWCDCFKSMKAWKTMVLGFLKHEHDIPKLLECPKSKEEKTLDHIYEKKCVLIKHTRKFVLSNSKL